MSVLDASRRERATTLDILTNKKAKEMSEQCLSEDVNWKNLIPISTVYDLLHAWFLGLDKKGLQWTLNSLSATARAKLEREIQTFDLGPEMCPMPSLLKSLRYW